MGYNPIKPTVNAGNVVAAQNLTVGSSAVAFAAFNTNTNVVELQIGANDIYVTFDGTTPSGSNGGILFSSQNYCWNVATARFGRFINVGSTSAIFCQEFQTTLESSGMPILEVQKPRYTPI